MAVGNGHEIEVRDAIVGVGQGGRCGHKKKLKARSEKHRRVKDV